MFRIKPKALSDIQGIAEIIASNNPSAAARWLEDIERKCQMIGENPQACPLRNDIRAGMRIGIVGNYLILYQATGAAAEIVRVLHGARDLKKVLGGV